MKLVKTKFNYENALCFFPPKGEVFFLFNESCGAEVDIEFPFNFGSLVETCDGNEGWEMGKKLTVIPLSVGFSTSIKSKCRFVRGW